VRHAEAGGGELLGRFAPVFVLFVVDDVVCAELFEGFGFGGGGGGCDYAGAGGFGKLSHGVLV